jgi:hypothetical protein
MLKAKPDPFSNGSGDVAVLPIMLDLHGILSLEKAITYVSKELITVWEGTVYSCYFCEAWVIRLERRGRTPIHHLKRSSFQGGLKRWVAAELSPRKPAKPRFRTIAH